MCLLECKTRIDQTRIGGEEHPRRRKDRHNVFSGTNLIKIEQMERATNEKKTVVMLGDMNINAEKWKDEKSKNKKVAREILGALEACGLKHMELGCTFLADNTAQRGKQ